MIWLPNENNDPAFNLAAEEYILSQLRPADDVLFFFIDRPSIIVGRHQNTAEEINAEFVRENEIQVVRRLSGGGAVYHDFGNLCFSFIFPDASKPAPDFETFTAPIVQAFNRLGVPAMLSGRNDLLADGAKFSGNAYYHNQSGSVCHGTLLFDSDLGVLTRALQPRPEKMSLKGIQSVRSRVLNLRDRWLQEIPDVKALRQKIVDYMAETQPSFTEMQVTTNDLNRIEALADARYRRDSWNYGESPKYNRRVQQRFPFGTVDARLWIDQGSIVEMRLFGDFFSAADPVKIERALAGVKFESTALAATLQAVEFETVFPSLTADLFSEFLLQGKLEDAATEK